MARRTQGPKEPRLAEAVSDTTLGEIVWRHLDHDLVAGQHADAVLAHLAGGMGDNDVVIGDQLHAEGRIGQKLFDDALELQQFFFGQWVLFLWVSCKGAEMGVKGSKGKP